MKEIIKDKLKILIENKIVSKEDIDKKLLELVNSKKGLTKERNAINSKLRKIEKQIDYWKGMLPDQTSLF